ncbi:MAG TPA: hypothetical protein VFK47_20760 [Ktedonobacteraceae bacterium]|nr:hypothetical protein [Ktedonobacteraceae bacterium]
MALVELSGDNYYQIQMEDPLIVGSYTLKITEDTSFTNEQHAVYNWAQSLKPSGWTVVVTYNADNVTTTITS